MLPVPAVPGVAPRSKVVPSLKAKSDSETSEENYVDNHNDDNGETGDEHQSGALTLPYQSL